MPVDLFLLLIACIFHLYILNRFAMNYSIRINVKTLEFHLLLFQENYYHPRWQKATLALLQIHRFILQRVSWLYMAFLAGEKTKVPQKYINM